MPQIATLGLNNFAAVAQSFNGTSVGSDGVARWYEVTPAIFDAKSELNLRVRLPVKGSPQKIVRVTGGVLYPIMSSVDPTVRLYEIPWRFEGLIPANAALANKRDAFAYFKNFLACSYLTAANENSESPY